MLNLSKALNAFTEDKFLAKAWADYLKECNDNWANLMAAMTEASTYDFDDGEEIDDAIDTILSTYSLNGAENICLDKGYTDVTSALRYVLAKTEQFGDVEDPDSGTALTDQYLNLTNGLGVVMPGNMISVVELFDSMKTSFHSSTVLQAAFESLDGDSIADRISVYKDKVQSKFTNVFDDISASFNVFEDMIGTGFTNVSTFIGQVVSYLGVKEQATDNNFILNDSDISQFTGASPLPILDFSSAIKAVGSVGKVIGQAVWSLMKGIGQVANKIFSWIGKKVEDAAVPYDLELINDDAVGYTVDGWGYTATNHTSSTLSANGFDGRVLINDTGLWATYVNRLTNKWIKFNFLGCEILLKLNSATPNTTLKRLDLNYDFKIKAKPINPGVFISCLESAGFQTIGGGYDPSDFYTTIASKNAAATVIDDAFYNAIELMKNSDYRVDIKSMSEVEALNCYACGVQFTKMLLMYMNKMLYLEDITTSVLVDNTYIYNYRSSFSPTNKDWLKVISGWNGIIGSGNEFTLRIPTEYNSPGYVDISSIAEDIMSLYALQQWDKVYNPTNFLFLPYQNNVADFDNSKFGIKTDSENQEALTKFLTVVVEIVIVIAVAVFAGVKIRKIKRNKFFKRLREVGMMDNAMWNGETLTAKQRKKYIKYSRKLNASSLLSGGLQESTSNALSSLFSSATSTAETTTTQSYDIITKLIK